MGRFVQQLISRYVSGVSTEPKSGVTASAALEVSPAGAAAWSGLFRAQAQSLGGLAGSTEAEFLTIGVRLQEFQGDADEVSRLAREVVDRLAGSEIETATSRLGEILDHLVDFLSEEEQEAARSIETFLSILQFLDQAARPLDGFNKINKVLRMLGTSTKVESARLGAAAAGFDTLANDVERLSVQIVEKSTTIIGRQEELTAVIRRTLTQVENMEAEQRTQVRTILQKIRLTINRLTGVNERCSETARLVSAASATVAARISDLVTAMQFHDIVRQQIEHVREVLTDLAVRAEDSNSRPTAEWMAELADICQLQGAQLRHARDELLTAVARIIASLRGIAAEETRLADDIRALAGVAGEAGGSFFAEVERDLVMVNRFLAESAVANNHLTAAMTSVSGTVAGIATFVNDIEQIGEEIELIALNAQVKAARTGAEGAALGVLAEAIQRLSVDTQQQTLSISEALRRITSVTASLCRDVDAETKNLDQEASGMMADLRGLLAALRRVSEGLMAAVGSMAPVVSRLTGDIEAAVDGIGVQRTMDEVLSEAIEAMAGIVAEVHGQSAGAGHLLTAQRLRELADHYTMQSERKVHATVAGAGTLAGTMPLRAPAAATEQDSEFGANVDLF